MTHAGFPVVFVPYIPQNAALASPPPVDLPLNDSSAASALASFIYKQKSWATPQDFATCHHYLLSVLKPHVTHLDLCRLEIPSELLKEIAGFPNLKVVFAYSSTFNEAELNHFAQTKNVEVNTLYPPSIPLFEKHSMPMKRVFDKTYGKSPVSEEKAWGARFPQLLKFLDQLHARFSMAASPQSAAAASTAAIAQAKLEAEERAAKEAAALDAEIEQLIRKKAELLERAQKEAALSCKQEEASEKRLVETQTKTSQTNASQYGASASMAALATAVASLTLDPQPTAAAASVQALPPEQAPVQIALPPPAPLATPKPVEQAAAQQKAAPAGDAAKPAKSEAEKKARSEAKKKKRLAESKAKLVVAAGAAPTTTLTAAVATLTLAPKPPEEESLPAASPAEVAAKPAKSEAEKKARSEAKKKRLVDLKTKAQPNAAPITALTIAPQQKPTASAAPQTPKVHTAPAYDDILPTVISYLFPHASENTGLELTAGDRSVPRPFQAISYLLQPGNTFFPSAKAPIFLRLFTNAMELLRSPQIVVDNMQPKTQSVARKFMKSAEKEFEDALASTLSPRRVFHLDLEALQIPRNAGKADKKAATHQWAEQLFGVYPHVKGLILPEKQFLDLELAGILARQKQLHSLSTTKYQKINAQTLRGLSRLPLTELFLEEPLVTGKDLTCLNPKGFQELALIDCQFTGEDFGAIALHFHALSRLTVSAPTLEDLSIEMIVRLPKLTYLSISTSKAPLSAKSSALLKTIEQRTKLKINHIPVEDDKPVEDVDPPVTLLNEPKAYSFFVGADTLDLRLLPSSMLANLTPCLPNLMERRAFTRLRLPPCTLDAALLDIIEQKGVKALNFSLCHKRDMQALSRNRTLTSLIAANIVENRELIWLPQEEITALYKFLQTKLLPPFDHNSLLPITSAELVPISNMLQLIELDLGESTVQDADLSLIAKLTQLESLSVPHSSITDKGLKALAPLKNLKRLNVVKCPALKDAGMLTIASQFKELEELTLDGNGLTDDAINALLTLPKLHTLILGLQSQMTPKAIERLSHLKTLKRLSITQEAAFGAASVMLFLMRLSNLDTLRLFVTKEHQVLSQAAFDFAKQFGRKLIVSSLDAPTLTAAAK